MSLFSHAKTNVATRAGDEHDSNINLGFDHAAIEFRTGQSLPGMTVSSGGGSPGLSMAELFGWQDHVSLVGGIRYAETKLGLKPEAFMDTPFSELSDEARQARFGVPMVPMGAHSKWYWDRYEPSPLHLKLEN